MKSRDLQSFETINLQIREVVAQASKQIVAKLITYYDQAIMEENDFVHSLNKPTGCSKSIA